ncbi:hypothetical protein [Legionella hackeliae]|uniref:Uncharacterized protein n=1 Tax=Legionella hackeliae TaxID=449 RepID=A0A0A8UQT6_LEGHA|nr:hypothetical protein [Legionella hackeliae]KTD10397.1 hypothetical protein Lhac_2765 [Legionella hackeliae]CEK09896.1 protein of unknown function [Legionella hackeliae]STX49808.1 Uncharacterised protein [Legionella hackeliae]
MKKNNALNQQGSPVTDASSNKKKEKTEKVPTLKMLAAQAVKKSNPLLFFQLNMELSPEIQQKYVEEPKKEIIKKAEEIYLEKEQKRSEKVEKKRENLSTHECFVKGMSCVGGIVLTGIYLAVAIPVLNAIKADTNTQATTYALTIVVYTVGNCFGMCFASKTAKLLVECCTPKVSPEVVDLENALPTLNNL